VAIDRSIILGVGGLIVGFVVGWGLGGSGQSELEAELADARDLSAEIEAVRGEVAGLGERLGGIETSVGALETAQAERIEQLAGRVEGQLETLGGGVKEAVTAPLSELRSALEALTRRGTAPGGAPAAAGGEAAGTVLQIGETAMLAGGALRVFLSSLDAEAGTARVAVNGPTVVQLAIGSPVEAGGCQVELTGIEGSSATIDGSC